ncbi:carbohydrate ABC transporter permease [Paenibacillus eucommiae]|uniref:ABC-type sugar transport system permease subunit n=1 Tax=Paenibacillus eucommiae TaxID=1355755 RepID=A0ABS4IMD0_9BACL|nr:sugar ABC transporter permease [Paenibacillus eucommiae]MBP1988663.1 ABC-type sugar transport system permease subunit [Paenibacillus eucommiae]
MKKIRNQSYAYNWSYIWMFAPGYIIYFLFLLIPILLLFYYSFFNWNGIDRVYQYVGLENYIEALHDKDFGRALKVTLFISITATFCVNVLGILFAVLLNKKGRMTNFYRSVFFFPLLISPVAVGFIWKSILSYNGLLNNLLEHLSLERIEFLGDPQLGVITITCLAIWQNTGFVIVIYLAGLQTVPGELYDAANIDGASRWQQFTNVTFPMLAPALTMSVVFMFTGMMREYDLVAVLTYGGPARATETIAYQVVRVGFSANRLSYSSSLAVYMLVLVGILAISLTVFLRRREERIL